MCRFSHTPHTFGETGYPEETYPYYRWRREETASIAENLLCSLLSVDIVAEHWNRITEYIWRWYPLLTHAVFVPPNRYKYANLPASLSHVGV